MEQKTENKEISTKANERETPLSSAATDNVKTVSGVFLSSADAEEYQRYRKQKKLSEVSTAIACSEGTLLCGEDIQRACERAVRLRQAALKTPLSKLSQAAFYLSGSNVAIDCIVGGTGETLAKVKAYEARLAAKRHAKEITLVVTPSLLDACRYGELRREIKRVRRAAGKTALKVSVQKVYSPTVLARMARLCSETGVKFFSVPRFVGCERLRMDLNNTCRLEVTGVETLEDYRKLIAAGVGRIVTEHAWEIYAEWVREANETATLPVVPVPAAVPVSSSERSEKEKTTGNVAEKPTENVAGNVGEKPTSLVKKPIVPASFTSSAATNASEIDYRCRLDGTQLKFL